MCARIGAIREADNLRYLAFRLSTPVDFEVSRDFSCLSTNSTDTKGMVKRSMLESLFSIVVVKD